MKTFRKIIAGLICLVLMVTANTCSGRKKEEEKETTAPVTTTAPTERVTVNPNEKTSPGITYFVPETKKVDKSYFDDVVFVGDSISFKLSGYDLKTDCLGNAIFLTSPNLSAINSLWDLNTSGAVHPSYNGQMMRVPDGVKASGRSKVYIMLGMNDLHSFGMERTLNNIKELVGQIKEASPGVKIFMQSITPIYGDKMEITNDFVNEYNVKLSNLCKQQGWYYIDVAVALRDENGALPLEYCGDPEVMGIHFLDAGCQVWADYLYTHTA